MVVAAVAVQVAAAVVAVAVAAVAQGRVEMAAEVVGAPLARIRAALPVVGTVVAVGADPDPAGAGRGLAAAPPPFVISGGLFGRALGK